MLNFISLRLLMWNLSVQSKHIFHFQSWLLQHFTRPGSVKFLSRGPSMVYYHILYQLSWKSSKTLLKTNATFFLLLVARDFCNTFSLGFSRPCGNLSESRFHGKFDISFYYPKKFTLQDWDITKAFTSCWSNTW